MTVLDTVITLNSLPIAKFFIQLGLVEELGSGFINVSRLVNNYGGKRPPQFIEGNVFKMIIPIDAKMMAEKYNGDNGGVNGGESGGVNDAVNDAVKNRLREEVIRIHTNGKVRLPEIIEIFKIKRATAQRDMTTLKEAGIVEFKGSPKNGGYYLTKMATKKLQKL
jgi:ATP-dependent DNA helicase RecG